MSDTAAFDRDDPLYTPLTIRQAMELTGRSRKTIDSWIKDGRLRVVKLKDPAQRAVITGELLEVEVKAWRAGRMGRPRKAGAAPNGPEVDAARAAS